MSPESSGSPGILLMTYGSPASLEPDAVAEYMTLVRGGHSPDDALVAEFTRRYLAIGGSPLIEITRAQAAGVERETAWPTAVGMRFSEPSVERGLDELRGRGVEQVAAIVLSPQFSPLLMGGYGRALELASTAIGPDSPGTHLAESWHLEPALIGGFATRIRCALNDLPRSDRDSVPVLLTAHSLPLRVAEQEPAYLRQLEQTATAIADAAGLPPGRWRFCWQSAGHEPGAWMKPDFADLMPELAAEGHRSVLVAPVQFLADHLEVLYDVDIGAREQARMAGLRFARIASLNDAPELVSALSAVALRTLGRQASREQREVASPA